jgi:TusA-related sulfurtransferase
MEAVNGLASGQALRLLATFEPIPLYKVLGSKGFDHAAREIGGGDWEVIFTPAATTAGSPQSQLGLPRVPSASASTWPEASRHLDNRDLDPPEPMVRTLAAVEELRPGEVLSALLCREPAFLLPELRNRGYEWFGGFEADGTTYKLLVRKAVAKEAAE